MKNPMQVWQALLAALGLVLTVTMIIISQSNRITRDEALLFYLQKDKAELQINTDKKFDAINTTLEKMSGTMTSILLELKDKKDRDDKPTTH